MRGVSTERAFHHPLTLPSPPLKRGRGMAWVYFLRWYVSAKEMQWLGLSPAVLFSHPGEWRGCLHKRTAWDRARGRSRPDWSGSGSTWRHGPALISPGRCGWCCRFSFPVSRYARPHFSVSGERADAFGFPGGIEDEFAQSAQARARLGRIGRERGGGIGLVLPTLQHYSPLPR